MDLTTVQCKILAGEHFSEFGSGGCCVLRMILASVVA